MTLVKTNAETVEDRKKEIVSTKDDEFLKINRYSQYDTLPEIKPYQGKSENIRFFSDGLEVLIGVKSSDRVVSTPRTLENSPINTTYQFQLINEEKKRILDYSIDAIKDEY